MRYLIETREGSRVGDQFPQRHKLPKVTQEETDLVIRPVF